MKVAARGSSTPSLRRMETIDEKDSAYNELSVSRKMKQNLDEYYSALKMDYFKLHFSKKLYVLRIYTTTS